jgi:hypothetical protein
VCRFVDQDELRHADRVILDRLRRDGQATVAASIAMTWRRRAASDGATVPMWTGAIADREKTYHLFGLAESRSFL